MAPVVWNGTHTEQVELLSAIERHCACSFDKLGVRSAVCAAHSMLIRDQRALNGLLWTRHLAKQLLAEEGISIP